MSIVPSALKDDHLPIFSLAENQIDFLLKTTTLVKNELIAYQLKGAKIFLFDCLNGNGLIRDHNNAIHPDLSFRLLSINRLIQRHFFYHREEENVFPLKVRLNRYYRNFNTFIIHESLESWIGKLRYFIPKEPNTKIVTLLSWNSGNIDWDLLTIILQHQFTILLLLPPEQWKDTAMETFNKTLSLYGYTSITDQDKTKGMISLRFLNVKKKHKTTSSSTSEPKQISLF